MVLLTKLGFPSPVVVPEVTPVPSHVQQLPTWMPRSQAFDLVVGFWVLVQLELADCFRLLQMDLAQNLRRRRR